MRMMRERINYTVLYDGDDEDSRWLVLFRRGGVGGGAANK